MRGKESQGIKRSNAKVGTEYEGAWDPCLVRARAGGKYEFLRDLARVWSISTAECYFSITYYSLYPKLHGIL